MAEHTRGSALEVSNGTGPPRLTPMSAIQPRFRAGPARGFSPWLWPAFAALLVVGVAVLDDYGTGWDEPYQRYFAVVNLEFVLGTRPDAHERVQPHEHFYGVAFELPLALLEYGMERLGFDRATATFARHLASHSVFLLGGVFSALLAWRMFHSRGLALLALLLFVVHPRLYAASFYNTKDIPFLGVFMIALYLTHSALRKDTLWAYALCGACVGVLINLRIQGWVLFVAVVGLRALDLTRAGGRRHVLATLGAFALAGVGTLYAVFPLLWSRPLAYAEAFSMLGAHPTLVGELFQGVQVLSNDLPTRFLPTWIAISTPPATLLLGALGAGAVLCSLVRRPGGAAANVELRFLLLVLGVLVVGVGAVVVFGARVYDGWRHMFFLQASVSVLAVFALGTIVRSSPPRLARAAQAATAVAALATCAEMAGAHPHQYAWFNFLVDRQTPEALASRYEMDHRMNACWQGVRHLADNYPQTRWILDKRSGNAFRHRRLLPPAQRKWFWFAGPGAGAGSAARSANVLVLCGRFLHSHEQRVATQEETPHDPKDVVCIRKIHNNTILQVVALGLPQRQSASTRVSDGPNATCR